MFKHGKSERDVRDEHSVHHVEMQEIGVGSVYHFNFFVKMQEIGCKE